jgi:hypothetical protein
MQSPVRSSFVNSPLDVHSAILEAVVAHILRPGVVSQGIGGPFPFSPPGSLKTISYTKKKKKKNKKSTG